MLMTIGCGEILPTMPIARWFDSVALIITMISYYNHLTATMVTITLLPITSITLPMPIMMMPLLTFPMPIAIMPSPIPICKRGHRHHRDARAKYRCYKCVEFHINHLTIVMIASDKATVDVFCGNNVNAIQWFYVQLRRLMLHSKPSCSLS
jgi:hypothetical protein